MKPRGMSLTWFVSVLSVGPVVRLYTGLYRSIHEGHPQEITPECVRRRIAVLQRCYELNNIPFPIARGE